MAISRRRFIHVAATGAGALLISPLSIPNVAFARADTERRFVFVIQRGAADGLNIVMPYGDPAYVPLRGSLAMDQANTVKLDGMFALHPSLAETAKMYAAREALFVHAVASPYRDRSHFDGQNVLETGGTTPYQVKDGWLNRLAGLLPHGPDAIAFAPSVPMALRGRTAVTSYAPSALPPAQDDLMMRVTQLYQHDAQLKPLWEAATATRAMVGDSGTRARQDAGTLGKFAATLLARDDGPRIAMIETAGWDTHSAQTQRLATTLKGLDALLAALRDGLGPQWAHTTVLVATEFGRTAAENGTGGTDHGTASAAMLVGGAVAGGRVIADWPGLRKADLYEGRDLKPTAALDTLIAGVAADSLRLDPQRTAAALFGQTVAQRPIAGLVRA
ncbi:DUF1501 domain-containing protein [Paraburkholderia edwinii]|jgi:uncharacterized protein (DUF1501 family)|uniref:DUF1501 domain-containing protein n=1 Tax=Paraburkholderia edwinii TaxID=2861782 RepID=A0ABX8UGH8_9BURK|nr:DUF1501 domain-containing protein [Paraburkholderia edwinii]QYD68010.1 DUF1501 domain-containing protein [Paraburkholderia edwinii]